jgi:hypothetical protein
VLEFGIYVHNSRLHFGAVLQSYSISSILVFTYSSRVCTLQVLYFTRYTPCFPVPNLLSEHVPELLTIIQHLGIVSPAGFQASGFIKRTEKPIDICISSDIGLVPRLSPVGQALYVPYKYL